MRPKFSLGNMADSREVNPVQISNFCELKPLSTETSYDWNILCSDLVVSAFLSFVVSFDSLILYDHVAGIIQMCSKL